MTPPLLSSHDVCRAAGVTYRQLDYWVSTGILTPAESHWGGNGGRRRWSHANVAQARVVKCLMGLPGGRRRIPTILGRMSGFTGRWLIIGSEAGAAVVDDDELARACAKFGPGCIVVDLEATIAVDERRAS